MSFCSNISVNLSQEGLSKVCIRIEMSISSSLSIVFACNFFFASRISIVNISSFSISLFMLSNSPEKKCLSLIGITLEKDLVEKFSVHFFNLSVAVLTSVCLPLTVRKFLSGWGCLLRFLSPSLGNSLDSSAIVQLHSLSQSFISFLTRRKCIIDTETGTVRTTS